MEPPDSDSTVVRYALDKQDAYSGKCAACHGTFVYTDEQVMLTRRVDGHTIPVALVHRECSAGAVPVKY